MDNKNLIHKSLDKSLFVSEDKNKGVGLKGKTLFSPLLASPVSKGKIPLNVFGTSLKNTGYISSTNVWNNSLYSFNQNYIKNIPSVDNIVNKMIKSFFTINALDNNIEGKKSKLIQRRFKRLSLNKILVSKSEIKHSNNKVSITVYLFNKKKRSLLLSLSKLYSSLSLGLAKDRSWKNRSNYEKLVSNFIESGQIDSETKLNLGKGSHKNGDQHLSVKNNNTLKDRKNSSIKGLTLKGLTLKGGASLALYNKKKTSNLDLVSKKIFTNKYAYMGPSLGLTLRKTNFKGMDVQNNARVRFSFINKILYYKRLNNITKYNIYKFINYLGLNVEQTNSASKYKNQNSMLGLSLDKSSSVKLLKEYFVYTNQYKLYSKATDNGVSLSSPSNLNGSGLDLGLPSTNMKTSAFNSSFLKNTGNDALYSISKLKSIYKIFALYNNISLELPSTSVITDISLELKNNFKSCITKKIMLNTYKLLKKSAQLGLASKDRKPIKEKVPTIILANKLNRIDRFLNKYQNTLELVSSNLATQNLKTSGLGSQSFTLSASQKVASNYKINFINDILEKELLYIHYLKLLSYNNAVFKNWFLFSLKNLIAKLYNKKVVLNLVNLKYIHLNSDILSQAVNIRLRNFRKNKIVDVLKKAVKLVSISKVNVYACDEHSSMYKYIHNYYDKFKHLKLDIFKELGYLDTNKPKSNIALSLNEEQNLNNTYIPCTIRRLNHIQTSTVNFIKFKSVFGVRLEAAGRLTKRSTASRAVFKFRYKGTLKNNPTINNSLSSAMIKNHQISNLQFTKISSKTRNGSFGLKGWINSN